MKLVIAAQDRVSITFGLMDENCVKEEKTVPTSPEGYLASLDQVLKEWFVIPTDIKTIVVVTGPGSFTASRVSTTLANGLGFAWNVPVVGRENPECLPLAHLDLLAPKTSMSFVVPTYDIPEKLR